MELVGALKLSGYDLKSQAHLLLICQSTIGISDTYSRIEPFHEELATWLNENWLKDQDQADMANICLKSIWRFIRRLDGSQQIYDDAQTCLEEDPFLTYALQSWGYHFARHQSEAAWSQVMLLMNNENAIRNYATLLCLSDSNASATLDIWPGCQPIHVCAFFGLVEVLDRLTNEHQAVDVNAVDSTLGRTALTIACQNGHVPFVQRLLQLGAEPTSLCKSGRSAFLEAIEHENERIFDLLLPAQRWDNTGPVSDDDNRHFEKALNLASEKQNPHFLHGLLKIRSPPPDMQAYILSKKCLLRGYLETFRCLTNSSALDWNYQNEDGETLLHVAARTSIENLRCVVSLLQESGRLAVHAQRTTSDGQTPAILALQHLGTDAHEALKLLRSTLAQSAVADKRGRTVMHHAAEYDRHGTCLKLLHDEGVALDAIDDLGWTPLHLASCFWNPVAVAALLEFGARAELVDKNGRTATDIALLYDAADDVGIAAQIAQDLPRSSLGNVPFWSQFRSGSDVDVQSLSSVSKEELSAVEPNNENNLLHWAAATNDYQKLELLLEDGRIDANARNADGHTPLSLHCTAFEGPSAETVQLLLTHGAHYHLCKVRAIDLLDTAIEAGCIDVAMIFIERCDALSSTSLDSQVLLQHAIDIDNSTAAEKLIARGASVLVHDTYGRLPIQQARETACSGQTIAILERRLRHEINNMYPLTTQLFASPELRSESPPLDAKAGRPSPHQNCQDSYAEFWTNPSSQ
jgi:ankyrin repeat protein